MENICCDKEMTSVDTYSLDDTRSSQECLICLECGAIRELVYYNLDDEELLSFLEQNDLEKTELYDRLSNELTPLQEVVKDKIKMIEEVTN